MLRTQPSLGVLLETKRFDFDDLAEAVDLDGDGFQELGFWTTTFDYLADDVSDSYMRGDVMGIVLNYLYAGRDAEAWAIHEKRYTFENRSEQRVLIEQRLAGDPFYQELRARMKRDGR